MRGWASVTSRPLPIDFLAHWIVVLVLIPFVFWSLLFLYLPLITSVSRSQWKGYYLHQTNPFRASVALVVGFVLYRLSGMADLPA